MPSKLRVSYYTFSALFFVILVVGSITVPRLLNYAQSGMRRRTVPG
ncbi:hypothetical protein MJD09_11840 [bacterium]|nr:hypothetical protein [bacterium]